MPAFFDPNQLSPEQAARWDAAVVEYNRIQEANVQASLAAMTVEERSELAESIIETDDDSDVLAPANTQQVVAERLRQFQAACGNTAGHPKSALFARLLNGKAALPFPPPLSFSYPWYAAIEGDGPFSVMIGGVYSVSSILRGTAGAKGEFALGLNQCPWAVISANDAARRLMVLEQRLQETAVPEKPGSFYRRYTWTPEFLADVVAAYADGPEFVVQYGPWPEYRLTVGRRTSSCQREYANKVISGSDFPASHANASSVFSAYQLHLNTVVTKVLEKGRHPAVVLEDERVQIERAAANPQANPYVGIRRMFFERDEAGLQRKIARFEANPDCDDTVEIEFDDWLLAKK